MRWLRGHFECLPLLDLLHAQGSGKRPRVALTFDDGPWPETTEQLLANTSLLNLRLSFLGFDAVSTLTEETRDPRRTIPRAIMLITLVGGAGVTFRKNFAMDPMAVTMVSADLPLPKNMDMAHRETYDGVSMRFLRGFDIKPGMVFS